MARDYFAAALAVMSGAGLLAGAAGPAVAQVLPSESFSIGASGDVVVAGFASFATFNTSLGTLDQVEVSHVDATGSATLAVTAAGGAEGGTASQTDHFLIEDPGGSTLFGPVSGSPSVSCSSFDCSAGPQNFTLAHTGDFSPPSPVLITGTGLTPFETGPFVELGAVIEQSRNNSCNTPPGSCLFTNDALFTGDLQITYDYTPFAPSAVPEPPGLALFGLGLLGLGCAVLRRRNPAAA